jgi:hypothetical protein
MATGTVNIMIKNGDDNDKTSTADEDAVVKEEFWPINDNFSLRAKHQIHAMVFGQRKEREQQECVCGEEGNWGEGPGINCKQLLYKSISGEAMTPLDIAYPGTRGRNNTSDDEYDDFYDGTGNLMWMAAVCTLITCGVS